MEADNVHPLALLDDVAHVWTLSDLDGLDLPDSYRYEIVDGAILVTPAPAYNHEIVSAQLRAVIREALSEELFVVGPAQLEFGTSAPIPDLVVARLDAMRDRRSLGGTEISLAVEVMSPSSVSADRILKPALYAAAGIANYWRVELDPLLLSAYTLDGLVYREVGTWRAGQTAHLDAPFPIDIDVAQLLPEA